MSDPDTAVAGLILFALHTWCWGYAFVLSRPRVRDWYVADWTVLTVIAGNAWVLAAYAALNQWGMSGWGWLLACNVAGGSPIVLWQLAQFVERRIRRAARRSGGGMVNE